MFIIILPAANFKSYYFEMKINQHPRLFFIKAAIAICLTALAHAAPAQSLTPLLLLKPADVTKADANEAYVGDENSTSQYGPEPEGALPYIEFTFNSPTSISAIRQNDRRNVSTLPESEMVFIDASGAIMGRVAVDREIRNDTVAFQIFAPAITASRVRWQATKRPAVGKINMGINDLRLYTTGQRENTPTAIAIKSSAPPIALRTKSTLQQTLKINIEYPYVEPLAATLQCGTLPPRAIRLAPGEQTVGFTIPVSKNESRTFTLTLATADKTSTVFARANVVVPAFREMTFHVLAHSHLDIGFTERQTAVDEKQLNNLLLAMDLAERTASYPEGARFIWNVENTWPVDLLMRRFGPAQQQRFLDAVRKGRISINGSYFSALSGICRPEELVRLFALAPELGAKTGVPIDTVMTADVPGLTWGSVTAMRQAGIKYYTSAPNLGTRGGDIQKWQNKPFWWVGPNKHDRVLVWVPFGGYGFAQRVRTIAPRWVENVLNDFENINYPYDLATVRWVRGDNSAPDQALPDHVRAWNERYEWPRFVISSAHDAFAALEKKHGPQIPEYRGDWTPFWEDGAGSTALETAQNRAAADRLSQAETLWAMLRPGAYPVRDFTEAMRSTLFYDEHTWGAQLSIMAPLTYESQNQWNYKRNYAGQADIQTRELLARALALAADDDTLAESATIDIFNTNSWPRTDIVVIPKDYTGPNNRVTDDTGAPVPSQRLTTGELAILAENVPPHAARRYKLSAGKPHPPENNPVALADATTLDNGLIKISLDPKTGDITELRGKNAGSKNNLADTTSKPGEALNTYLYFLGTDYKNAQTSGPATIRIKERGPLITSLVVVSSAPGCHSLTREIRLVAGRDHVEIANIVDKARLIAERYREDFVKGKESLNFAFPFNVPGGQMRLEAPLAIMRPDADQIPGSCKNWYSVNRWADVSNKNYGVTWVTLDAPLAQLGSLTAHLMLASGKPDLWVKEIGPTQKLYTWAMNNHWGVNYRPYQEGPVVFRFILRPHGAYDPAAASRLAIGASQPLLPSRAFSDKPLSTPRLAIDSPDIVVTAMKPSNDGRALIIRLWNSTERDTKTKLRWSSPAPRRVMLSDTGEQPLSECPATLEIPAQALVTIRAEL